MHFESSSVEFSPEFKINMEFNGVSMICFSDAIGDEAIAAEHLVETLAEPEGIDMAKLDKGEHFIRNSEFNLLSLDWKLKRRTFKQIEGTFVQPPISLTAFRVHFHFRLIHTQQINCCSH